VGENLHTLEVVHLGNSMEEVVLGGVEVGIVVVLCVVHMTHMVVGMVGKD